MDTKSHQVAGWLDSAGPNARIAIRNDIPIPRPAEDEVVVKGECTGICYSDIHRMFGDRPLTTGVMGHEGVGRVVSVGANASKDLMGKRVGVGWLGSSCMACEICEVDYTVCPQQKNPGRNIPGTYQQYMAAPAKFVTIIPEQLPSEQAAPLLCAGVTMYSAIRKLDLQRGAFIAIQGAGGGLGHIGVQICKAKGYRVIAIDSGTEKRDLCLRLGASIFVDYETEDLASVVTDITGGYGAHAVLCVPGSPLAYQQAFPLVRRLGTVSCLGLTNDPIPVSPREIASRGIKITGSCVGTASELAELLDMAVAGDVRPVVETFEFEELDRLHRELKDNRIVGRAVVKIPQ